MNQKLTVRERTSTNEEYTASGGRIVNYKPTL